MDDKTELKVFSSEIERGQKQIINNLYDLLQIEPAKPKPPEKQNNNEPCNFTPTPGKYFQPKKRIKGNKVKTVRDIRNEFEKDIQSYLPGELLKQETSLFNRIRNGSSTDGHTIKVARNMLKCGYPISRSSWQMITNLNPDKNLHSNQYVLWNGKKIRVNGSKGGDKNYICHYDLGKKIAKNTFLGKKKQLPKKRNLLKSSLALNLKPGPLSKKKNLDNSYQKQHIGTLESVRLPHIGLEIEPAIGVSIEPTISNILHSLREINGTLTETWAVFAVSTLGNLEQSEVTLMNNESVTFSLNYHNNQNKLLMRHDGEDANIDNVTYDIDSDSLGKSDSDIENEVQDIVKDLLTSIEISLTQDTIYTGHDEPRDTTPDDVEALSNNTSFMKERNKKKYNELEKLDVTVIRIPDLGNVEKETLSCNKAFCTLGCICSSLESSFNIKRHCGKLECMFECKCEFSRYKTFNGLDETSSDLLSGLINLDTNINSKLAKEEKKFHQTVLLTEQKSIFLKSQRRNLKAPKRYAEFYNSEVNLKEENHDRKFLSISALRLDCKNIEPWCMVHSLYQCFCHGKFTHCFTQEPGNKIDEEGLDKCNDLQADIMSDSINSSDTSKYSKSGYMKMHDTGKKFRSNRYSSSSEGVNDDTNDCARTTAYRGRNFSNKHYYEMNQKIVLMEKNDSRLHAKMMSHLNKMDKDECDLLSGFSLSSENSDVLIENIISSSSSSSNESSSRFPNKAKLVTWLEANYKHYKKRLEEGRGKIIPMEPPKQGKIALYPWEVILDRYKKKKNYFVVTKDEPFRIFMAVNLNKSFFSNCISIDQIPFENLRKYPITVRNLLQDASDMKDNFYIMSGLSDCWELIGSVTKLKGKSDAEKSDTEHSAITDKSVESFVDNSVDMNSFENTEDPSVKKSKWFAMIVNYDFTEIQFHSRGFFVKYDYILKAINVARASQKTVRLSSQKFAIDNESPQFGIYAIPFGKENRVFIGPYEMDDELGIEFVRAFFNNRAQKSRGVWFTSKKTDNVNVIDSPMKYMPLMDSDEIIFVTSDASPNIDTINSTPAKKLKLKEKDGVKTNKKSKVKCNVENDEVKRIDADKTTESILKNQDNPQNTSIPVKPVAKSVKVVKPIKISRKNSFYQIRPSVGIQAVSLLKPLTKSPELLQHHESVPSTSMLLEPEKMTIPIIKDTFSLSETVKQSAKSLIKTNIPNRPIAEIAPQKKMSQTTSSKITVESGRLGGMFILKPEEINERLSQNNLFAHQTDPQSSTSIAESNIKQEQLDMDIENFLATSEICEAPTISDDVYAPDKDKTIESNAPKDVFIECQNIENLGWIKGKRNKNKELSFEFPGFKFTDFYNEDEAFLKINQVLSRKVYVPKNLTLLWTVIESEENLTCKNILKSEDFGSDIILTKRGLRHTHGLLPQSNKESLNRGLTELRAAVSLSTTESPNYIDVVEEANKVIKDLKKNSRSLESEKRLLQTETSQKKSELLKLLKVPNNDRLKMTEELKDLKG